MARNFSNVATRKHCNLPLIAATERNIHNNTQLEYRQKLKGQQPDTAKLWAPQRAVTHSCTRTRSLKLLLTRCPSLIKLYSIGLTLAGAECEHDQALQGIFAVLAAASSRISCSCQKKTKTLSLGGMLCCTAFLVHCSPHGALCFQCSKCSCTGMLTCMHVRTCLRAYSST